MIKVFKKKTERTEEEEKKGEEGTVIVKPKKAPGEIRLKKEISELDLPGHASIHFPDPNITMKFEVTVDLKGEDCLWKGGKYTF